MLRAALIVWAALSAPAIAQQIAPADYATLKRELDGIISFETLPQRPEPGMTFDHNVYFKGAWLGERFQGQVLSFSPQGHDKLSNRDAETPLRLLPGQANQNQSVAFHNGFASNALFPLGQDGIGKITGRGEGALAILFDHDQAAMGLRVHTHYATPLGNAPVLGRLQIAFFTRAGVLIDAQDHNLSSGITELGWRRARNIPDIAGVVVTNTDPGGVAIDDIIFQLTPPLG
ncbi:hypothetical protein [Actibacterium lipolyticum]|uniref:Uncharacterized protein n=1 Tax=Actibacterium lipolyticum TaxID=1524263 RepID=A0A238KKW4_9RHOB|nr:hypothetical protein [Actibacterium lipolyticum]SMX43445.1 hypothetical protein COL8621_02303 [Actibacterium lipolyticum]